MRRAYRLLRSPRTALWLIALTAGWVAAGSVVSRETFDAFTHPAFLVLLGLLALSIAVCAWERSARAVRVWRGLGVVTRVQVERLRARPTLSLPVPVALDDRDALDATEAAMRELRMRVRSGSALVAGRTSPVGLLGSPLFHWSLAGLIVAGGFGSLAGASGLLGVIEGESVIDEPSSYRVLDVGPLHGGLSGLEISVAEDMSLGYVLDNIDRGPAPLVTLSRDGREVASGLVYPNSPLRHGTLTVHMSDYGVGVVLADERGGRGSFLIDLAAGDEGEGDGGGDGEVAVGSREVTVLVDDRGEERGVEIAPVLEPDESGAAVLAEPRRVMVRVGTGTGTGTDGDAESAAQVVGEGDAIVVGERELTVERVGYYARLSVSDDPAERLMYAVLLAAVAGAVLAVAVPFRSAWAMVVSGEDGRLAVHVKVRDARREGGFAEALGSRVRARLDARASERERDGTT